MRRVLLFALLLMLALPGRAQLYAMRDSVDNGYDFWLYLPEKPDTVRRPLPVVLFLHGRSLCGRDLYRVRRYGCLDALTMGRKIDAAIIAPQNRGDGWWNPRRLLNVLEWAERRYDLDTTRVYVMGMSLGGFGTVDFAGTYPDKVAAAIALCGGGTLDDYSGLARVPLWIIHGTADRAVPVRESRKVAEAVEAADTCNLLVFDPLRGVNHSRLARVFYMEEAYRWLFSHSLADSVRTVDRSRTIDVSALGNAYLGLKAHSCRLKVFDPVASVAGSDPDDVTWHTVRKGDTLGAIAIRYRTSVNRLCQMNGISKTSILRIGQKLRVR